MAISIIWSPKAEETFDGITDDLLESWSEKVVRRFVQETFETIDRVAIFPHSSPSFKSDPNIRRAIVNKHVSLIYRVQEEKIELITFWSNRQDLENMDVLD
ncbi:MAG: type II toxin-antitoxin system RelE/ParE family toxin [Bacteroidota bacterium]